MKKKLPKSIRKHIRKEKALIRRKVLSMKEQEKLINQLYEKFLKKSESVSIKEPLSLKQDKKEKPKKEKKPASKPASAVLIKKKEKKNDN